MFYRILATLTLSFVFYAGIGQLSFHRIYETGLGSAAGVDTFFHHMSSTTLSGGVFAMGTKRTGNELDEFEDLSLIFTRHDNKGNALWSKELDLGVDSIQFLGIGSAGSLSFNGAGDSLLFTIPVVIDGARAQLLGRMDQQGEGLVLQRVGGLPFNPVIGRPLVKPLYDSTDVLLTYGLKPTLSRIGLGSDLIWSRSYDFLDTDGDNQLAFITDLSVTADSSIFLVGAGAVSPTDIVVAELDSNGVQIWAERFSFNLPNLNTILPTSVEPLSNGNFAVAGILTTNSATSSGFVSIIDTAGSPVWVRELTIPVQSGDQSVNIYNLLEAVDGTLWISGSYFTEGAPQYFTTNIDFAGMVNWTSIYPGDASGLFFNSTSLLPVQDTGGASLISNGIKDDVPVMQVIRHEPNGTTTCSDTITTLLTEVTVAADTLVSQVENGGIFIDSLAFELEDFSDFNLPTLRIQDAMLFCPNEQIDTFLVAVVDNVQEENIMYEWGPKEGFTDSLFIDEDGMYMVTVTISEDYCYMMCDTVDISRLSTPGVAIAIDTARYCEERIIVLNAQYSPGAPDPSFLWSTGETTQSIEVAEFGTYGVTVVDDCDETASAEEDVQIDLDPTVFIQLGTCFDGQQELIAVYSGIGMSPQFTWSTGESGGSIFVSEEGEYVVTVSDECGGEAATADIDFEYDDNAIVIDEVSTFEIVCREGGHRLSALIQPVENFEDFSFVWSTGDADFQTIATTSGTYTVTATGACGEVLTESIDVNVKQIPEAGEITYMLDCDEDNIDLSRITFSATAEGGNPDNFLVELNVIDINENQVVSSAIIPSEELPLGNYRAELTTCDTELLAELTVNATALCGGLLQYPIVFFPQGEDEESKTFGPIPSDTISVEDMISDVEFKVFNRWGETVFESNDILDAWDGTHNGEPAPSEVYIWYVTYMLEGVSMIDKGDVTLIR